MRNAREDVARFALRGGEERLLLEFVDVKANDLDLDTERQRLNATLAAQRASGRITVDGKLNEPSWQNATTSLS